MSNKSEIIAEAKYDYYKGVVPYKNPYPFGSEDFNLYERGWMQALKYDGGRRVR